MNIAAGCQFIAFRESANEQAALEFQREVFEKPIRRETEGIIFDVSGVSLMDSFTSKNLADICRIAHVLGKKTAVVGLKPAIVASLVNLEVDLSGISAAVNIEEAILLIQTPKADTEPLEEKATTIDEDAGSEEGYEDDDEGPETEEASSE